MTAVAVHAAGVLLVAFAERDGWPIPFGWERNGAIVGAFVVGLLVGVAVIAVLAFASPDSDPQRK